MKTSMYKSLLVSVTFWFFVSSGPEAHSQNIQVNFGVTFRNARLVPLWIADEEGFFKKQGLDVKQVNISGGTQGAQMMVSGRGGGFFCESSPLVLFNPERRAAALRL